MSNQLKNRIVSTENVCPKQLRPNIKNFRKHPKKQRDALSATLQELGWIQDVIVNRTTGNLIDGHLRLQIAIDRKEKLIPVKYVELTEKEESLALATFDPISALAETEKQALDSLLRELPEAIPVEIRELVSELANTKLEEEKQGGLGGDLLGKKKQCPNCGCDI